MTTRTPFFKVSGSGNDFLALIEPKRDPTLEEIRAWCRRGVSLGADGLFTLRRGADSSIIAMDYWNSDGRPANLCLNATRCAVQVVREIGWSLGRTTLETAAGPFVGSGESGDRATVEISRPAQPRAIELIVPSLAFRAIRGWFVMVGVPHLVVPWEGSLANAPVVELGRSLRQHTDLGPEGANVNFVAYPHDPSEHGFGLRTYERGVEDETLSCGTGVIAATRVGVELGRLTLPASAETQSGFRLEIDARSEDPSRWTMRGDARIVAQGELTPSASTEPSGPSWREGRDASTATKTANDLTVASS